MGAGKGGGKPCRSSVQAPGWEMRRRWAALRDGSGSPGPRLPLFLTKALGSGPALSLSAGSWGEPCGPAEPAPSPCGLAARPETPSQRPLLGNAPPRSPGAHRTRGQQSTGRCTWKKGSGPSLGQMLSSSLQHFWNLPRLVRTAAREGTPGCALPGGRGVEDLSQKAQPAWKRRGGGMGKRHRPLGQSHVLT